MPHTTTDRRVGNLLSTAPYTIVYLSNPTLWTERGQLVADPGNKYQHNFDRAVDHIDSCLFGGLKHQAERLLTHKSIGANVRARAIWITGEPVERGSAFVREWRAGRCLVPRRHAIAAWLEERGILADVVMVVSGSSAYRRGSAIPTTDDTTRGGVAFSTDQGESMHWYHARRPGAAVTHQLDASIEPLHEFSHAASSFQSGVIGDLYVDIPGRFNARRGRPIPATWGRYGGRVYGSDKTRPPFGYDPPHVHFHCERVAANYAALMDDFKRADPHGGGARCAHDAVTADYLRDRIAAKIGR